MVRLAKAACVAGLLTPSLAVRVATEEAQTQEIDWRKLALAGAVGAHALCGNVVGAAEEECQKKPERNLDDYDKIEALLLNSLSHADAGVVEKLLRSLRGSSSARKPFVKELEEHLRTRGLTHITAPTEASWWSSWWSSPGELNVQHYTAKDADGSRAVVLKRYLADSTRGPEEVTALQNVLRTMQKKNGGNYLQVYAKSHVPSGLSEGDGSEVMVMTEPFSGSLLEYFASHKVSLPKRLHMFYSVMEAVDGLYRGAIPHNSVITPDNILVTGDLFDPQTTSAVLCPSIFNTDLQVCTPQERFWQVVFNKEVPEGKVRALHVLQDDMKQLGDLLHYILHASTGGNPEEVELFEELANAMKEGAFKVLGVKCRCGAARAFTDVTVQLAFESALKEELDGLRGKEEHHSRGKLGDLETWESLLDQSHRSLKSTKHYLKQARRSVAKAADEASRTFKKEEREAEKAQAAAEKAKQEAQA